MSIDLNIFWGASGFAFGVFGVWWAIKERKDKNREQQEKNNLKETIDSLKSDSLIENITKGLGMLPGIEESAIPSTAQELGGRYIVDYLNATSIGDQNAILDLWVRISSDVGQLFESAVKRSASSPPHGLAEYIGFTFLSAYSSERAQRFLDANVFSNPGLASNFARYYLSSQNTSTIDEMLEKFGTFGQEEVNAVLSELRGQIRDNLIELFRSEKWNRRIIDRLREYVNTRNLSYNSVVEKLLETNPLPKLYLIFKNEGSESEEDDKETRDKLVTTRLREMRERGEISAISYMSSIYFGKDPEAIDAFLNSLPAGTENNYVVFVGEIDPLTMNVKTSDKLVGRPQMMYQNLLSFRDLKNVYNGVLIKLGVRPSEFIQSADLGFLLETKSPALKESLRKHSTAIKIELSSSIGKKIDALTDLKDLDEDDAGQLAALISEKCKVAPSIARDCAKRIVIEAKELYDSIYGRS